MGFLLDDILLFPIKGALWVGEKIKDSAEAEMTDESQYHEALMGLQIRLEMEEITEEEYRAGEEALLKRLDEIRKYKEERDSGR